MRLWMRHTRRAAITTWRAVITLAGAHDVYTLEAATARSDEQGAYLLSIQ